MQGSSNLQRNRRMISKWETLLTKLVGKREPGVGVSTRRDQNLNSRRQAFRRQAGVTDCGKLSPYPIPLHCPKNILIYRVDYLQKEVQVVLSQLARKIEEEQDLPGSQSPMMGPSHDWDARWYQCSNIPCVFSWRWIAIEVPYLNKNFEKYLFVVVVYFIHS